MAYIFPSKVGQPAVITDVHAQPITFLFGLGGWPGFSATNCVLQGVTASSRGNYQFLHTIGNFTYVYVFGELMGDYTITGVALSGDCPSNHINGIGSAIAYYNTYAISTTGTPVIANFMGLGFLAFLVGAAFAMTNPKTTLGQFQLSFKIISN